VLTKLRTSCAHAICILGSLEERTERRAFSRICSFSSSEGGTFACAAIGGKKEKKLCSLLFADAISLPLNGNCLGDSILRSCWLAMGGYINGQIQQSRSMKQRGRDWAPFPKGQRYQTVQVQEKCVLDGRNLTVEVQEKQVVQAYDSRQVLQERR
jgi:hypothetical protein